jgi:chromosome partitioning protein
MTARNGYTEGMGIRIVFANQKGGVGKTTSTVNIGAFLADAGKQVLLVDFDPQGNLSSAVGADKSKPGIYELLSGTANNADVVQGTDVKNLFCIAASINLSGATVELVNQENREFFLQNALEKVRHDYDYILIDCPPSLGILTVNGLSAADQVMIPMQTEYFALEGLSQLVQSIKLIQKTTNPKLEIGGIFFTMYDSRTRLAQDVVQEVIGFFGKKVFRTIIPRNVRLSEAPSHGVPINLYDASCLGAKSYKQLSQEVLDRASETTR